MTNDQMFWDMAVSYERSTYSTGVAIGSNVKTDRVKAYLSQAREFFPRNPTTILLSEYSFEGSSKRLLVLNVHAINFATTS
ncbi:MAG: hypothetical protein ABL958_19645, partial [Bdellovibrionia bacterium]